MHLLSREAQRQAEVTNFLTSLLQGIYIYIHFREDTEIESEKGTKDQ